MTYKEIITLLMSVSGVALVGLLSVIWSMLNKRMDSIKRDVDQTRTELDAVRMQTVESFREMRQHTNDEFMDIRKNLRHEVRDINNGLRNVVGEILLKDD
jgi:hypothetical protein